MKNEYDVIIFGAGPAGITAAIQAGRLGARTLLIEKNGTAGGTIVTGGISTPGSFYAYNTQIIAGIGWELCCRVQKETDSGIPSPKKVVEREGGTSHFMVSPAVFAAVCDEMLLEAGSDILFHAMPASVERINGLWRTQICTKSGLHEISAKNIIDCTGDANVVSLAGFDVKSNDEPQAATLVVKASGYDADNLDYDVIQNAFEKEIDTDRMKKSDAGWQEGRFEFFLRNYGGNRIHLPGISARTSEEKTLAEIEGRKAMLRILRFCRKQPGLEKFTIESCAAECGIRETVTIKGQKELSVTDYEKGLVHDDSICYSFYMLGIHRDDQLVSRDIAPAIYPTIPFGALLPSGSKNIMVAGRSAASDQEANAACRIQASCMAMGQAAGAAATLSVKKNVDLGDVNIELLRTVLRNNGAIVPPELGT